tara:strand:- start:546 stop:749 length:204 start_codon:yes stop_codon:yes gene_type:complete
MNIVDLKIEDLNAILKWYNLAYNVQKNSSQLEEIPDENTLIKIRALFLTKDEEENRDKKFRSKFGGR